MTEQELMEVDRILKKVAKWERQDARRAEREAFVNTHGLACFKCGTRMNEWAAARMGEFGPWALCVRCHRDKWRAA